jgi:hypothetical protein
MSADAGWPWLASDFFMFSSVEIGLASLYPARAEIQMSGRSLDSGYFKRVA